MKRIIDIQHEGLMKYRRISGNDKYVVEQKANSQLALWDEIWSKKKKKKIKER